MSDYDAFVCFALAINGCKNIVYPVFTELDFINADADAVRYLIPQQFQCVFTYHFTADRPHRLIRHHIVRIILRAFGQVLAKNRFKFIHISARLRAYCNNIFYVRFFFKPFANLVDISETYKVAFVNCGNHSCFSASFAEPGQQQFILFAYADGSVKH